MMPSDCSCVPGDVPGQIPLWKCVGGEWRPFPTPFPTTSGCLIKIAEAQSTIPEADEWCRPKGYPVAGAKRLSHRHHTVWVELRGGVGVPRSGGSFAKMSECVQAKYLCHYLPPSHSDCGTDSCEAIASIFRFRLQWKWWSHCSFLSPTNR